MVSHEFGLEHFKCMYFCSFPYKLHSYEFTGSFCDDVEKGSSL